MAALVSLNSVSQRAGHRQLFSELNLAIEERTHLAVVGPNGSGKSTLLSLIAGRQSPDEGRVIIAKDICLAVVSQIDNFSSGTTALQVVRQALITEYARKNGIHDLSSAELAAYFPVAEAKAKQVLSETGFENVEQIVDELSGGWRKRLALATAIALEPDLLLLDEPTNHLDLQGLLWLENYLKSARCAWVLVSHDRYFLERTASEVIEIAPYYEQGVFRAVGNYSTFVEKRQVFMESEAQRIASLANKVKGELEWAARMPKARTTKAGYRLREAERLEAELRERKNRQQTTSVEVSFTASERQTRELVKFISVNFGYDNRPLLTGANFTITNGTCLGILGKNGQGKSSLLRLIGGALNAQAGKIKRADTLRVVYFDQLRKTLDPTYSIWQALGDGKDSVPYQGKFVHIVGWAKRFGFDPDELQRPLAQLSGGQQARILLAKLATQEADLLILDEPTNDLDIPMLETLEAMLLDFEGASVLVTHDRFMLNRVCSHYLGFNNDQQLLAYASYDQWERECAVAVRQVIEAQQSEPKPARQNYKNKKEAEQIERKIAKAEQRLIEAEERAALPESHASFEASQKISKELAEIRSEIDALYERWESLI